MEKEIREIQLKCLEILDIVDEICRENNIQYSLCGGSVVGAHLYKGCLPWDDDVDLMMTRSNYNRFVQVISKSLPKGFSVRNYQLSNDFETTFTKIINDNTTVIQQDGTISGVFLDITVYDKIPMDFRFKWDEFLWKISQVVTIGRIDGKSIKIRGRNFILSTLFKKQKKIFTIFPKSSRKDWRKSKRLFLCGAIWGIL